MKFYFILFVTVLFISCSLSKKTQNNISCPGTFDLQTQRSNYPVLRTNKKNKTITIYFLYYFNDKIKMFINEELKFDAMVVTNSTSGMSGKGITYNYSKDRNLPILKLEIDNGNCIDFKAIKKYKFIYLWYDSTKIWTVRFSNKFYSEN